MVHWLRTLSWLSRLRFLSTIESQDLLIFHLRMYLYETSRNIQKPWAPDLYFTVYWLRALARLSRLRFLSKVESRLINGSKLIFHIRNVFLWDQQEYTKVMSSWSIFHGLLTSDFGQFSMVDISVIGRFLSSADGSKLIYYQKLYLCETSRVCFHAKCSCSWVGLEINI